VRAGAAKHDLVLGHGQRHTLADAADRPLEVRIGERHHQPAAIAYEVMMMRSAVVSALEAHHCLPRLDSLYEAEALELVEDPLDARPADRPRAACAEHILDLDRGQRATLASEQLEHRPARAAALAPVGGEQRLGAIDPTGGAHRRTAESP
jgi:hypothetical protein